MTPYIAYKYALLEGVLTTNVYHIASMIMADEGKCPIVENWAGSYICNYEKIRDWLLAINMPAEYLHSSVSVYLATYYPATYQAFLEGKPKDVLRRIIMKEKKKSTKNVAKNAIGNKEGRYYQKKKDSSVYSIRARRLDKRYDWNTIK